VDPEWLAHVLRDHPVDEECTIDRPTLDQLPAAGCDTLQPGTRVGECVIERRLEG
jgi:hypothetical protein